MGIIHGKNQKISNMYKTERGAGMNQGTRNKLEVKLKKMLNHFDQIKAKQKQTIPQLGIGNIIRRRAGEKEKRFSYCI
jgi:hypothetical protein